MSASTPDFDSIKHQNVLGHDYWSARELMPLLGYGKNSWHNFVKAIEKAIQSCESAGLAVPDHFYSAVKKVGLGSGAEREIQDYFLSKRACFLIAQNGDPRKPQIAAAQQYFAFTAEVFDMAQAALEEKHRLQLRLKVAEGNAQLSTTALNAGVKQENLGLFHDGGYVGMYRMAASALAAFWNLGPGEEILDVMGPEALAANLFRIAATDAKLRRDNVQNENVAIATHHDVGAAVRRTLEEIHQVKPEDLPRAANIRKLVEDHRRKARKQLENQPPEGQDPLF